MSNKRQNQNNLRANLSEAYQSAEPFLSLGLTLAVTIVAFLFLGYWLDSVWNTEPWLTVTGGFVGLFLGYLYLFYSVRSLSNSTQHRSDDNKKHPE